MTPARCLTHWHIRPCPADPNCRGWTVNPGRIVVACSACKRWEDDEAAVAHVLGCRACADLAVELGASDPLVELFEGLRYESTYDGQVKAAIYARGQFILETAAYPTQEGAREAGFAWLRRLRGQR